MIIQIITEIAGQTNLLALNAAIEAAGPECTVSASRLSPMNVRKLADSIESGRTGDPGDHFSRPGRYAPGRRVDEPEHAVVESGMESVNQTGQVFQAIVKTIRECQAMWKWSMRSCRRSI